MDRDGWMKIVAEELMVPAERVRSLAGAVREVGLHVSPADLIGAGTLAALGRPIVVAGRPADGPPVSPRKPLRDRLRPWQ